MDCDDFNNMVFHFDKYLAEYEKLYEENIDVYLRLGHSLFSSLPSINISSLNTDLFDAFIRVSTSFASKKEILLQDYVKNVPEWILLILNTFHEKQADSSVKLLALLYSVLKGIKLYHPGNSLDPIPIIESLSNVTLDRGDVAYLILKIMKITIEPLEVLADNVHSLFETIFDYFKSINYVEQMCSLGKIILEQLQKMSDCNIRKITEWILKESVHLIDCQDIDSSIKKDILLLIHQIKRQRHVLEGVYPEICEEFRNVLIIMMNFSHEILKLCQGNDLTAEIAQEMFSEIVLRFLEKEEMLYDNANVITGEINQFFAAFNSDTYISERIFFFICHMQESNNRLMFKPNLILQSMANTFYDRNREMEKVLLKTFLFLYPRLAVPFSKPQYIGWGIDYLRTMAIYAKCPSIYSFNQHQLLWILKLGITSLKLNTLRQWLSKPSLHEVLMVSLINCKAGYLLMRLIVDDFGKETGNIAVKLLRRLKREHMPIESAEILPVLCKTPQLFNCLILSRPAIPENNEEKMVILSLMGVMMPSFTDPVVLRAACLYTNDILDCLKGVPECLDRFMKCMSTIKFLSISLNRTPETTSKEVLVLLKNLICIQLKSKHKLSSYLTIDVTPILKDNSGQTIRCISMLHILLKAKADPFMKIMDSSLLGLWYRLQDLSLSENETADTQKNSIVCLNLMMTRHNWLAASASTDSFIRMCCHRNERHSNAKFFVIFMVSWIKILEGLEPYLRPSIPVSEMQSLAMRFGSRKVIDRFSKFFKMVIYRN